MPRLRWDEIREHLQPNDGLRYVVVVGPELSDWQAVLDLVRARGWHYEFVLGGRPTRLPARAADALERPYELARTLRVRPEAHLWFSCHFFDEDDLSFVVDPAQFRGQEDFDELCHFVRAVGRRVRKPVVFAVDEDLEAFPAGVLLRYSPDQGVFERLAGR